MKTTSITGILALMLLGVGQMNAQGPTSVLPPGAQMQEMPPAGSPPGVPGPTVTPGPAVPSGSGSLGERGEGQSTKGPPPYPPGLSPYINYLRPCGCCGPLGNDGPIQYELFTRHGVSLPLGGGVFGRVLDPGYTFQGGGRTLFFEPSRTSAWTVELSINTTWWDAGTDVFVPQKAVPVVVNGLTDAFDLLVTPTALNQTAVHLAIGQEFYLTPPPRCCSSDTSCRIGYDVGLRWGSAKVGYGPIIPDPVAGNFYVGHGTDVIKGAFVAGHADLEWAYKCCIMQAGVRAELVHVRSDILQPINDPNMSMLNVMFNFGVRF